MTDKTISLDYLLRLRGDMALAGMQAILKNLKETTATLEAVLAEMQKYEKHYQLESSTGKGPVGDIVETMRRMAPDKTAAMTDDEILRRFGPQGENK